MEDLLREAEITHINMPYPKSLLRLWQEGDYSMLEKSGASDYIKRILIGKAKNRPGTRFFGEAFVASNTEMREGWYNSYKWLTDAKWITGISLTSDYENTFHNALMKYIGAGKLATLQEKVKAFSKQHPTDLVHAGRFHNPVAPDLWIVDRSGNFRFIECKLPGDTSKPHQRAGLFLIKQYLDVPVPLVVSVVNLNPVSEYVSTRNIATPDRIDLNDSHQSKRSAAPMTKIGVPVEGKDLRPAEGDLIGKTVRFISSSTVIFAVHR